MRLEPEEDERGLRLIPDPHSLVCSCGHSYAMHTVTGEQCTGCYCSGFKPQHPVKCGCSQCWRLKLDAARERLRVGDGRLGRRAS